MANLTILLQYQYLKHDIDQWTFRLAGMRITDDEKRSEAQSDSSKATDISYYRRKIVEAIAKIKSLLKDRIPSVSTTTGNDTLSTSTTGWQIELEQGNYINDVQTLTDLMHQYVVRSVITDWSVTYAPDSVQAVSAELQDAEQQLVSEAYNRKKPLVDDNTVSGTTTTIS